MSALNNKIKGSEDTLLILSLLDPVHNDNVVAIPGFLLKWYENRTLIQDLKIEKMINVIKEFI